MRVAFVLLSLAAIARASIGSLPFEIVSAYYLYKAEVATLGLDNQNRNLAKDCVSARGAGKICTFDEFVRHVMPDLGPRYTDRGNWGGPDPESPDPRTVGQKGAFGSSSFSGAPSFKDIEPSNLHKAAGDKIEAEWNKNPAWNPSLWDYTKEYERTLDMIKANGRVEADHPDLQRCRAAAEDARLMRSYENAEHLSRLINGKDYYTKAGLAFELKIAWQGRVTAPDGTPDLAEIDWQKTQQDSKIPPWRNKEWTGFHKGLVKGYLADHQVGLEDLKDEQQNKKTYLKDIRSHNSALGAFRSWSRALGSNC